MKILSKEATEKRIVLSRMLEGIKCDVCGRVIPATIYIEPSSKYFSIRTGHRLWGNDSCESIEYKDICPKCVDKFVIDYIHNSKDTYELELETEYCIKSQVSCTE